jgi:hypothetical protein
MSALDRVSVTWNGNVNSKSLTENVKRLGIPPY